MSDRTVLVVEDDHDLSNIYSIILKHAGYQVQTAFNGQEALDAVEAQNPDLILLDIFMPIMDGKTFLEKFDITKHKDTHVVVCSNTSDAELLDDMLSLGADKVVTKSTLEPNDLEALVAPYLS